jgi:ABC-type sugar transport system ATPase subunit
MRCRSVSDLSARNAASFRNSNVAQNIFLGQTAGLDIIPRGQHRAAAVEILQTLAPHLRVDTHVSELGMADRQLVEISRTLARGGRIIALVSRRLA